MGISRRGVAACRQARPTGRAAFTLIEMLVVISMIALLVSITLPALAASRETARRTKCLANLKGIGVGVELYLNDYKRVFPYVLPFSDPNSGKNDKSLLELMGNYVEATVPHKDAQGLFIASDPWTCPSDRASDDAESNYGPTWRSFGTSYEFVPGEIMLLMEFAFNIKDSRGVSRAYESRDLAVLRDFDNWHTTKPKENIQSGDNYKNALYYRDWRADKLKQPSQDELNALISEVLKYYGIVSE